MKRRLCAYCGAQFVPRRKSERGCSRYCASQTNRSKNLVRTDVMRSRVSTAGHLSPEASGSVSIKNYRAEMRIEEI